MRLSENQIIVYQSNETVRLDVRLQKCYQCENVASGQFQFSMKEAAWRRLRPSALELATLNNDRFIIVDQKEIFWTGASLKDAGRLTFAARMLAHPSGSAFAESSLRNASHFFGAFRRLVRRSSPGFLNQSARRRRSGGSTAKRRRRRAQRQKGGSDIIWKWNVTFP